MRKLIIGALFLAAACHAAIAETKVMRFGLRCVDGLNYTDSGSDRGIADMQSNGDGTVTIFFANRLDPASVAVRTESSNLLVDSKRPATPASIGMATAASATIVVGPCDPNTVIVLRLRGDVTN